MKTNQNTASIIDDLFDCKSDISGNPGVYFLMLPLKMTCNLKYEVYEPYCILSNLFSQ